MFGQNGKETTAIKFWKLENRQVVTNQTHPRKWKPKTAKRTKTRQLASENPRKTQESRELNNFEVGIKVALERRKLVEILFKQHFDPQLSSLILKTTPKSEGI